MRQVTFELDVPIAGYAKYRLVPRRTVTEGGLFGRASFDTLVEHLKRLGCKYKIEATSVTFIEGDESLDGAVAAEESAP